MECLIKILVGYWAAPPFSGKHQVDEESLALGGLRFMASGAIFAKDSEDFLAPKSTIVYWLFVGTKGIYPLYNPYQIYFLVPY